MTGNHICFEIVDRAPAGAPWLALVHGVSQDHRVFDRQVEAFAGDHRLILIDLPGHGRAADRPGPYGVAGFAAAIEDALVDAGVARCHLWATHLGAGAGLLLASERPGLFESLILEGPVFPGRPLPVADGVLALVRLALDSEGIDAAREVWWTHGPWFDVMRARPAACRAIDQRAIVDDFQGAPWRDSGLVSRPLPPIDRALAALDLRVLIYNGEHDHIDFVDHASALSTVLRRCVRSVIPGGGGFPLWEEPEATAAVVRAFLGTEE